MNLTWDNVQKRYFSTYNLKITADGIIKIPRGKWAKMQYRGVDANTGIHNWMIPSINGCCLIFEHSHFEIV